MNNMERIKQLEAYVAQWDEMLTEAVNRRDRALALKALAVDISDDAGVDVLQKQADQADAAALKFHECRTRAQTLLGRAQAGDEHA
ncbi:MAG: hypothetical protein ACXWC4_00705 [Telluria sp.]